MLRAKECRKPSAAYSIGRSREADGLSRMIVVSLVLHGVFMTALVLAPLEWRQTASDKKLDADDDFARPFGHRGHGRHDGHHEPARAGGNANRRKAGHGAAGGEDA